MTSDTLRAPARSGTGAHIRHHRSVLADSERRVLVWMAERTPAFVNSDHLTAIGLASMVGVGLAFWAARSSPGVALPLVPMLLALNWLGDSLDGTLARVRHCQRPRYGFYVDHVIDLAGSTCLFAGLALSGYMSPLIALAALAAFLLVSAETYLATQARGIFNMSFLGWGPTELRVLLSIGALKLMDDGWISVWGGRQVLLFDVGGIIATCGLGITFLVLSWRNGRALYKEETTW